MFVNFAFASHLCSSLGCCKTLREKEKKERKKVNGSFKSSVLQFQSCLLRNFYVIGLTCKAVLTVVQSITELRMGLSRKIVIVILVLMIVACLCEARGRRLPSRIKQKPQKAQRISKLPKLKNQKQLLYETRETSTPNFVTLLFFRLVYGIATQMGLEDRLPGFIAPPNADEDGGFFSFGSNGPSLDGFFGGGDDDYDLGI